jgi:phage/plasmid-like protein (TIGR03299 family)
VGSVTGSITLHFGKVHVDSFSKTRYNERTFNTHRRFEMAHEIEVVNGIAQMVYVGDVPWHGLGTKVPADLSPEQVLQKAGLDWTVQKVPAFATIGGKQVNIGRSALVRSADNKVLDVVTNDWNPLQNQEAFEFFDEYCRAGDMEMHTAGSLKGGQIVWALAKVKDSFELFKGDTVESYLLLTNPHKFGQSIDVRFTPIRVVCNNTLTLSLSQNVDRVVKKNHRTSSVLLLINLPSTKRWLRSLDPSVIRKTHSSSTLVKCFLSLHTTRKKVLNVRSCPSRLLVLWRSLILNPVLSMHVVLGGKHLMLLPT